MTRELTLNEIDESQIDSVLSLNEEGKTVFFDSLITQYFPNIKRESAEYHNLQVHYRACWLLEKIYRNNGFMKECFSVVYTKTGLIRNIWNDLYYTDDDLIIH
jgi:hypothetical protein